MRQNEARFLSCMYVLSLTLLVLFGLHGLRDSVTVSGEADGVRMIVVDPGHGGMDGGSSAADGTRESDLNLSVALKTDAVLALLGEQTVLTRQTDTDLSGPEDSTIAQKKVSDIRARTALVNELPEALLVSIHQNTFPADTSVHGAQVFYNGNESSQALAEKLQQSLVESLDRSNTKAAKPIDPGIYLMNHIEAPGVLVECGFLTNPAEVERLKSADYQKRLALAIAAAASNHLHGDDSGV